MKGSLRPAPTIQIAAGKLCRLMTVRAPNRAAVHGTRLPVTDTLQDKEKVEKEIEEAKAEKEKKRKDIEETLDSKLKIPQVLSVSDSPPAA